MSPIAYASMPSNLTAVRWNSQTKSFEVGAAKVKVSYNMICGYYNNQAEYASFGVEQQLYKCSKIIIPVDMSYKRLFGRFTLAPLYDQIKAEFPGNKINYGPDSKGRPIQGNNPYFDWYKNLGTRVYYLGDYPILQAYLGVKLSSHQRFVAGRIINSTGLADEDTPWGDDGMFSPYAYWLSRDLLTGLRYRFINKYFSASASLLSGNNPMKGYANYLNHVQGPNLKANNTPSLAAKVIFNWGHFIAANNNSQIIIAAMDNTMSSTWAKDLGDNGSQNGDGKRRNSVYAAAWQVDYPFANNWRFDWFGQYTLYLSGLTTNSSQYDPKNPYFKNITQQGVFTGIGVSYRLWKLYYTFSYFDRFDYNVYQKWIDDAKDFQGKGLGALQDMQQYSHIINFSYQFNSYLGLQVDYQYIKNPVRWVSSILDNRPDYRFGAALQLHF